MSPCYSLLTGRIEWTAPAVALSLTEKSRLFSIVSETFFMWRESKEQGDEQDDNRSCYDR
jgi:hypothetical protein